MATYIRNVQGESVPLKFAELDPDQVRLDPHNPRLGFTIQQLAEADRNEAACELLLTSQEETESLKRSILHSKGVQEPIYVREEDMRVAEGNRRIVALRAARSEQPGDPRLSTIPTWLIPPGTSEHVVRDLLNEIHIGSVRGWAPYEKALQLYALIQGGLVDHEVAERYRMSSREVRQHLSALETMRHQYFPQVSDPTDPEHRAKYSYFLEFWKNSRLNKRTDEEPDLPDRFSRWVRDGRIDKGVSVRRLPKILDSDEATALLESVGFEAAVEYLKEQSPEEQELYALLAQARNRLQSMTVTELIELGGSQERQAIVRMLREELDRIQEAACRVEQAT